MLSPALSSRDRWEAVHARLRCMTSGGGGTCHKDANGNPLYSIILASAIHAGLNQLRKTSQGPEPDTGSVNLRTRCSRRLSTHIVH